MNEQTAALNMPEKFMAETYAVACALNESRDIRHNERIALAHRNNAEHGSERREMIIRNNGLSLADNGNKR